MGILDQIGHSAIRSPGAKSVRVIAFNASLDGAGAITLNTGSDYDQQLSVTKSGNNYIVNVGPFVALLACVARTTATLSTAPTVSPTAGTVQINFGSGQTSTQLQVILVVDAGGWT